MDAVNLDLFLRMAQERRDRVRQVARSQQADGLGDLPACCVDGVALDCVSGLELQRTR